jgi:protein MpaA
MSDCMKVSLVSSGAKSRNGSPILIRRYTPAAKLKEAGKSPVRILLLGGIHGDELTASAIVFQWMQSMHTDAAQNFRWEVVPVLNPDGMFAPKPTRLNAGGIDLNRNFPTPNWLIEAPRYWKSQTGNDPRRFPGKAPLSEPETKWVNEEMARFRPHVIISVHAPFGILDFDGPSAPPQRFGRLVLNPLGVYPGSLGNYSGKFKNVPVITIELPNALAMPTNAETQRIWLDMLDWITRNVEQQVPPAT